MNGLHFSPRKEYLLSLLYLLDPPTLAGDLHIKSSLARIYCMTVDQSLQKEIKDSQLWLSREKEESTYKRDLKKRIELINWVLDNMRNPSVEICSLIESRMNETIQEINKTNSIFESDKLHVELRILDWIFYQVCKDQQKSWEKSFVGLPEIVIFCDLMPRLKH